MIVAIHQPNFFPWIGYFDKIANSDIFIFLDDVQFPKKGGVWSNRVKLLIAGEARWVTATIDRKYHGFRKTNEIYFLERDNWREKMLKSIETNYRKHPYYTETMKLMEPLILNPQDRLAVYNGTAINTICHALEIPTDKLRWSSQINHQGHSSELLVSLTYAVGGKTYMCGGGADGYQNPSVFSNSGIDLTYQNFSHPSYPQINASDFIPGLSIIDAAMNCGWAGLRTLLHHRCKT